MEAAHEKGVNPPRPQAIHIKVTPDGKVKVLDFGLAKAFAGRTRAAESLKFPYAQRCCYTAGDHTGHSSLYEPGASQRKTVDKTTDVFAFGVVLFEMLTGRQFFTGETVSETLAAVLMREPEWARLPTYLHPQFRQLL